MSVYGFSNVLPTNWALEAAKGNIPQTAILTRFGFNPDVDTASAEGIIQQGGNYVPPTTARIHNISSSDINDTSAGTGARTILIFGIDGSYNRATETVTMNGTTNMPTVNSYHHIHLVQIITAGSTANNIGTISAVAQTDATTTITVSPGFNQSCSSVYLVPVGYKGYIMKIRARMQQSTATSGANIALLIQPFGGVYQTKTILGLNNSGNSEVENDYSYSCPFIIQEKSFIKLRCLIATNNNTEIMAEYDLIVVQN